MPNKPKLGAPLKHGERAQTTSVNLPPSLIDWLRKRGKGQITAGVIKLAMDAGWRPKK